MDWRKIAPWNWFKDEVSTLPVAHSRSKPGTRPDPLEAMRAEIDRVARQMLGPSFPDFPALASTLSQDFPVPLRPSVDISEGKKAYTVRAELPGLDQEDVSIEVEDHTLVIRGEKRQDRDEEDEGYHWVERSYGEMQRVISLPDDADVDEIEARFKNGVLKLRIPKHAARASMGRSIEIQAG
jgi:HSP20 family protein